MRKIFSLLTACMILQAFQSLAQNTNPWPSSGSVGIGTTSPAYQLHVVGNIYGSGLIGETLWTGDGTQGTIRKLSASIPLRFLSSSGAEEMRIDGNGNVGIGTSSPTNGNLEISANANANRALYIAGKDNYYPFEVLGGATTGQSYGPLFRAGTSSADASFSVQNRTGSSSYLTVRGDGNTGIGTTSPTTLLDVTSSTTSGVTTTIRNTNSGAAAAAGLRIGNNTAVNRFELFTFSSNYTHAGPYYPDGSSLANEGAGGLSLGALNASGDMRFYSGGITE